MKIAKKAVAALLATGILASATGCSDMSWSYKNDNYTLSIGTYIYYMAGAYSYAQSEATSNSSTEAATNADGTTEATEAVDVLAATISDDDDNEITGRDYILNTAEQSCKTLIYTLEKFDELGLSLSSGEQEEIDNLATQGWSYSGSAYETLGVSQDSYSLAYAEFSAKYEAVFNALYGEGGEMEVSDEELEEYYTSNYVDYSYIPINLYETVESDDEDSESATTTEALSEDEIAEIQAQMDEYSEQLSSGEQTFEEVDEAFMEWRSLDASTASTAQELLDSSVAPTDIIDAVKELENNSATVITVGEDDTAIMYLVYRGDISEHTSNLDDENTSYSVLTNMKSEEYNDYMDEQGSKLEVEVNEAALGRYTPEELENKMKELEAQSASSEA